MQSDAQDPQNFEQNNPAHTAYLVAIFNRLNELFSECGFKVCGGASQGALSTRDSRIRFDLTGIYYHADASGIINYDGSYDNLYCENTYGLCDILDVFFCELPQTTTGYGPGDWVLLSGLYYAYLRGPNSWGSGNLLGHELGHCFNIHHSWECSQKCKFPDICQGGPLTGCSQPCGQGSAAVPGCYGSSSGFCQPYPDPPLTADPFCSNNMMSYSRVNDHISPLQMAQMHLTLASGGLASDKSTHITTDVLWQSIKQLYGDVYIHPGARLTIRSSAYMPKNTRIVVMRGARLVVNGGRLLPGGPCNAPGDRWQGIEVWGNTNMIATAGMLTADIPLDPQSPGAVILQNATVESANIGVQTQQNGAYDWFTSKVFHFNGLVFADNTSFKNCRKAAEFLNVTPMYNPSVFTTCAFTSNLSNFEGITAWQTNGIFIGKSCSFQAAEAGVVGLDAALSIKSSTFTNNQIAIKAGGTAPLVTAQAFVVGGAAADQNIFKTCNTGVVCEGYNLILVSNNLFEDDVFGVRVEGSGGFRITNNSFKNSATFGLPTFNAAIQLTSTGGGSNLIRCNNYQHPATSRRINAGIAVLGNNSGLQFKNEIFSCWDDVRVLRANTAGGGFSMGLLSTQGSQSLSATNSFTGVEPAGTLPNGQPKYKWVVNHRADINAPSANAGSFDYRYPPGIPVSSRELPKCPVFGLGNGPESPCENNFHVFSNLEAFARDNTSCDAPEPPEGAEARPGEQGELTGCRTETCLNAYYESGEQRKKDALLDFLCDSLFRAGNAERADYLLARDPDRRRREMRLGLRLQLRDWVGASAYLDAYPIPEAADAEFVAVQRINLHRLMEADTFHLAPSEHAILLAQALGEGPQTGYARSLLGLLTGEHFDRPLLETQDGADERSNPVQSRQGPALFDLFPNPAQDLLHLMFSAGLPTGEYTLLIADAFGRAVSSPRRLTAPFTTDIGALLPGIYVATVLIDGRRLGTRRFVKQ